MALQDGFLVSAVFSCSVTISTVLCCLLGGAIALVGTAATFPREVVLGFDQPVGDAQDEE